MPFTATPDINDSLLVRDLPAAAEKIAMMTRVSPHFANLAKQYEDAAAMLDRIESSTALEDDLPSVGVRNTKMIMMMQIRGMLGR